MKFRLGMNTGFAVNRYAEPEVWTRIVGDDLGLPSIQMTAEMLNPDLPSSVLRAQTAKILRGCQRYHTRVTSTFTGAFTRVNHLAHPDPAIRKHWLGWFRRFVDLTVDLGAEAMGSHFGIFTTQDNADPARRALRRRQNIEAWQDIGSYAKDKGLKFLSWEPMSISREQGETLSEARQLQADVNKGSTLPFYVCLDVDHGDVNSPNPDDTDPYAWLRGFANVSPQIHLKQSSANKTGHWPFTAAHNAAGRIQPARVLETLRQAYKKPPFTVVDLLFEFSFREREPMDSTVIEVLRESVAFWKPAMAE